MIIKSHIDQITEELNKLQNLFDAISMMLPDRHFIVDNTGVILARFGNPNSELFYDAGDIVGKKIQQISSPELSEVFMAAIESTLKSGTMQSVEYSVDKADLQQQNSSIRGPVGPQWFEIKLQPLDESVAGVSAVICSNRNITQRKLMEIELKELAQTDPLTTLYNRRFMMAELDKARSLFKRYSTPAAVMMLDIDFFKKINDTYGHDVGDLVLVEFSSFLQREFRDLDIIGRVGGEEFLIIIPASSADQVKPAAERLLEGVRAIKVTAGDVVVSFTVSGGLSEIEVHDSAIDAVLKRADQALYVAKKSGRDQIILGR